MSAPIATRKPRLATKIRETREAIIAAAFSADRVEGGYALDQWRNRLGALTHMLETLEREYFEATGREYKP